MERIQAGETASLPELGPEILFSLLVPFVGPGAASEAMEAERARPADGGGRPAPA
jgi:hypothetical protein